MMFLKRNIPNLFTLSNLLLGVLGIYFILTDPDQYIDKIHYFIFTAAIFDLLDGLLARLLKVQSALGAQLDSLADLVTFGVLPGFIYLHYTQSESYGLLVLIIPVCAAIRLAIFNIETEKSNDFKGISTTAQGIFTATIPFAFHHTDSFFSQYFYGNELALTLLGIGFALLMVSRIRMVSLKFNGVSFQKNWEKYILLTITTPLVVLLGLASAPYVMITYLLLSLIIHLIRKD